MSFHFLVPSSVSSGIYSSYCRGLLPSLLRLFLVIFIETVLNILSLLSVVCLQSLSSSVCGWCIERLLIFLKLVLYLAA